MVLVKAVLETSKSIFSSILASLSSFLRAIVVNFLTSSFKLLKEVFIPVAKKELLVEVLDIENTNEMWMKKRFISVCLLYAGFVNMLHP